jgi:N-acylneuraminate cytidylyltransferase
MTNTIAIIPARGGSKRLPNKNILQLGNRSLLAYSIEYAKVNGIQKIYVSTDNENIKKEALNWGALVIDRPSTLSGDFEPTITALQHVLTKIDEKVENVVLLQPTNPLRPEFLLKKALDLFQKDDLESLFTVSRDEHKLGKIIDGKFLPFNYKPGQRSQDLEPLYFENGLLYIAKAALIEKGELMNENSYPLLVEHPFAKVDIDTQEDFNYAEYLLKVKS